MDKVENLITAIRNSFPGATTVYTKGACFEFYKILKSVFPDAEPYYDHHEGHVYTKIDNKYYDIDGRLFDVPDMEYMLKSKHLMKQVHRWVDRANFRVVRLLDRE